MEPYLPCQGTVLPSFLRGTNALVDQGAAAIVWSRSRGMVRAKIVIGRALPGLGLGSIPEILAALAVPVTGSQTTPVCSTLFAPC